MSNVDRTDDFVAALGARGWDLVQRSQEAGMMAERASFGRVRRKLDGLTGFAKCIWVPGPQAGATTHFLADPDRLNRLHERINLFQSVSWLPIVAFHDVAMIENPACLLIVMEQVTPIWCTLPADPDDRLAARILRDFAPVPSVDVSWLHFDICPANSAKRVDGTPVLIDPESIYISLKESEFPNVSILAAKWHRSPSSLAVEVQRRDEAGEAIGDVGVHKHAFEVILLAAEVSLGQLAAASGHQGGAERWLLHWLSLVEGVDALRERVSFWRGHLVSAFDRTRLPDLRRIADELDARFPASQEVLPVANTTEGDVAGTLAEVGVTGMDPRARAMREERLSGSELDAYLGDLCRRGRREREAGAWLEACVLCVCYLRDPLRALEVVREGLAMYPDHRRLRELKQMIGMWVT